jgi:APA family basic amino acid/polyamine antiporter
VIFIGWIFYGLAATCVFIYRRRTTAAQYSYRVPGYPFTPLVFIAGAALLVLNTIIKEPKNAAEGIGIVLAGAPMYVIWSRRKRVGEPEQSNQAIAEQL